MKRAENGKFTATALAAILLSIKSSGTVKSLYLIMQIVTIQVLQPVIRL